MYHADYADNRHKSDGVFGDLVGRRAHWGFILLYFGGAFMCRLVFPGGIPRSRGRQVRARSIGLGRWVFSRGGCFVLGLEGGFGLAGGSELFYG